MESSLPTSAAADLDKTTADVQLANEALEDQYEDTQVAEVTRKDLMSVFYRHFFMQASFNYERMQSAGWLWSLLPVLKKVHTKKSDLSKSMKMHMEFFNTSPALAAFMFGIVSALEQGKERVSTIRSFKIAAMGPIGGIGDAMFQMTLIPIAASIGATLAAQGNVAGPLVFFVMYNVIRLGIAYFLMFYGYSAGVKALAVLKERTAQVSRAATILGLMVVGALVASFVRINTQFNLPLGESSINVQTDILDAILPNSLPLLFVFAVYHFLVKKSISPTKLIGLILAFGIVGKYAGFL